MEVYMFIFASLGTERIIQFVTPSRTESTGLSWLVHGAASYVTSGGVVTNQEAVKIATALN